MRANGSAGNAEIHFRKVFDTCSIEGCNGAYYGKGLCQFHYGRSDARKEAKRRYNNTEKGKETARRYEQSEKGRAKNLRYMRSDKGALSRKMYISSEAGKSAAAWGTFRYRDKRLIYDRRRYQLKKLGPNFKPTNNAQPNYHTTSFVNGDSVNS